MTKSHALKFFAVVASASILASGLAYARSVHTSISMGTFVSRCKAAGGEVSDYSGGKLCILPSGATVACYSADQGGINCDIIFTRQDPKGVKGILGNFQPISMGNGNPAGHGRAGGSTEGQPGNTSNSFHGSLNIDHGTIKGGGCSGGVC